MGLFGKIMDWLDEESGVNQNVEEITFGRYQGQPIVWIPIDESCVAPISGPTGNCKYYITKNLLFRRMFNDYNRMIEKEYNVWASSPLREYLNGDFFESCFNNEEKDRIFPCRVTSFGNSKRDAYRELFVEKNTTIDRVFLPNDTYMDWVDRLDKPDEKFFWTRMALPYLKGLGTNISESEQTDNRRVIAIRQFQRNRGTGQFDHNSIKSYVNVERFVRPVICIINF